MDQSAAVKVVKLPGHSLRMRESDRLVREWGRIRNSLEGSQRAAALLQWGLDMEAHLKKYEPYL